ncbi:MAG: hypothetical protein GF317_00845 [Candidatus Lokiarchaeota archaeon]|nr:hypothetical protein [Candidatus Lokiarchaeota archaeon]MBD3198508.1 hypothetical protein [Candidatus Lokiarchaeota archaeon]
MEEIQNSQKSMKNISENLKINNEVNTKSIPDLQNQLDALIEVMERLITQKTANLEEINIKTKNIKELKENLSELNLEILKIEEILHELNKENNQLKKTREKEEIKGGHFGEILNLNTNQIDKIEETLNSKENIEELSKNQAKFFENLKSMKNDLERQVKEKNEEVSLFEQRLIRFKELLNKKFYVNSPDYLLLKNLELDEELNISVICKEMGIDERYAEKLFIKLKEKGAPIEYDNDKKRIILKEEIDF